ncbi:MAG TPA: phosphopantothenoylcysteine decarboxylase [Fimbriiglobus sp.]|nr:phosphopantothenoylcysteine decarboxylase [Fimbriiglobus sp.]
MNVLVTAGNTQTPIDRVRCVTNIFTGRTGARVAVEAHRRGHAVTFLTSHPEVIDGPAPDPARWRVTQYRTYDDLDRLMGELIPSGGFDAVIHAAAVSDYAVAGVYAGPAPGAAPVDAAGKIKSHHDELWLRLVPTAKLVDKVRGEWGFRGVLVKFKLEVGVTESELLAVAERSRLQSAADAMVANAFETRHQWAYLGVRGGPYERLTRSELAPRLLAAVEELHGTTPTQSG